MMPNKKQTKSAAMLKRIKEILKYILAEEENLLLQDRLLVSSVIAGTLITFIGSIICIVIGLPFIMIFTGFLLSFLSLAVYYFIRVKKIVTPFKILFYLLCVSSVVAMWILDGGINGQSSDTMLVAFILLLIIVPNKNRIHVLFIFLAITLLIYLIQYYKPDIIIKFSSDSARWLDGLTTTIYTTVFVFFIIQFLLNHYNTEKTKALEGEKRQIEINADKDRFISVLAHDLRSPFSGLLSLTESLKENLRSYDIDEIEEQVKVISQSAEKIYNLLEDLLIWALAQNDKIPFNLQRINLLNVSRSIRELLLPTANLKNIRINCREEGKLYINADPEMLKTVLRNLVSNAIKFTPHGGTVTIGSQYIDSKIRISVSDNGVGIDPRNIKRLFDISQIFTTKGTEDEEGTGLGLLICKKFAEKHGWEIQVNSHLGKGSTFHFTIPYIDEPEETYKVKNGVQTNSKEERGKKMKVLIVEDDEISRMLLEKGLETLTRDIQSVDSGNKAVRVIRENPDINLILMDISMPIMDGYEALKQIREFNKDVIIIAQTAFGSSSEYDKVISAGFSETISKPINKDLLFSLIKRFFPE